MEFYEFTAELQEYLEFVLLWVGFGTVVGLLAKAIMPGRDPGGAMATVLMGIGGAIIGCGVLSFYYRDIRLTPISPMGFTVAVFGAFFLLFFYRVMIGHWFIEGDAVTQRVARRRRNSRRTVLYDD